MTEADTGYAARTVPAPGRGRFITGLGVTQIVSWGTLYYSFPLIAEPMSRELALAKPAVYGAATVGILVAGLASLPVGAAIDRGYGRAVMTLGSVLGGLLLIGWSQVASLWPFYFLFAGVGLAQAMTMYEPAFAVIARRYGAEARRGITAVTLWGGFASTVFIPLTQLLLDVSGWRSALIVLGACNLALCVPLHAAVISPRRDAPPAPARGSQAPMGTARALRWVVRRPAFWGLVVAFTVYYGMFVGLTFHLYPMLQERGFAIATIIAAIAIIGPAQVAGRIAMWLLARERSVRIVGLATVAGFPVCLLLLILLPGTFATLAAFALVYGAVNGITTIVRGLVVPELLTRDAYGAINGLLALPANIAKAFAPAATAALWAVQGSYDLVLWAALASSVVVVLAFTFASASAKREPVGEG